MAGITRRVNNMRKGCGWYSLMVGPSENWVGVTEQKGPWSGNCKEEQEDNIQSPKSVVPKGGGKNLRRPQEKQSPRKSAKFPAGQERETNTWRGYRMMTDTEFQRAHWRWKEEWPEWNTQYWT